jgi:hypothetical protein
MPDGHRLPVDDMISLKLHPLREIKAVVPDLYC